MKSPISKLVEWQIKTGKLDGWTAYHLGQELFLKIFQWLMDDLWWF
ncbi:MAG: hypothetical protein CM15mV137_120 [uncultured marine virus]|nr:MAG: hypothetical protein CM15mV137_120 [uncultured marine virus]